MKRFPQFGAVFGVMCLGLSLSQGCARSDPRNATGSPAGEQKLPFHPEADQASASEGSHPAVSPDPKATNNSLPFGPHARTLPSGTLLTVQLENTLSTSKVRAGDAFTASVAAPLAIDGDR